MAACSCYRELEHCTVASKANRRHINPYTLARLRKLGCDRERLRVLEGFGAAKCIVSKGKNTFPKRSAQRNSSEINEVQVRCQSQDVGHVIVMSASLSLGLG